MKKVTLIVRDMPANWIEDSEYGKEITVSGMLEEIEFDYDPDIIEAELVEE
jgi:hypothetical protein